MPITWDNEETQKKGSITWDDEESSSFFDKDLKEKEVKDYLLDGVLFGLKKYKEAKEGVKAIGSAGIDLATGTAKMLTSIPMAAVGTIMGEDADIARDSAGQALEDTLPAIAPSVGSDKHPLYQGAMWPLQKIAEGINWAGENSSDNSQTQGLVKQGLDIASLLVPGGVRRGLGKIAEKPLVDPSRIEGAKEPFVGAEPIVKPLAPEPTLDGTLLEDGPTVKPLAPEPTLDGIPLVEETGPSWKSSPADVTDPTRTEPPMEASPTLQELAMKEFALGVEKQQVFEKRPPRLQPADPIEVAPTDKIIWKPTELSRASLDAVKGGTPTEVSKFNTTGERIGERRGITESPLSLIEENPQLLQDPIFKVKAIDYWSSILEDLNLPTEKVSTNKTLQKLIGEQEQLRQNIEKLLTSTKEEAAGTTRIYAKDIVRSKASKERTGNQLEHIQQQISKYIDAGERVQSKLLEVYREPLTRKIYPENIHPFSKKQGGGINTKAIREGFQDIGLRFKEAFRAMREDIPSEWKNLPASEGMGTIIQRGVKGFREGYNPKVFIPTKNIKPINRGPGGKQSGAILIDSNIPEHLKVIVEKTRKGFELLKDNFPRFSEISDVRIVGPAEWRNHIMEEARAGRILKKDLAMDFSKIPMLNDANGKILANIDAPIFQKLGPQGIAGMMVHELTHGLQRDKGRMAKWSSTGEQFKDKTNIEQPWEKQAMQAEGTWAKRMMNKGPGGKQSGAVDPKAILEELRKGSKNLEDFTKKMVDRLGENFRPLASALYKAEEKKAESIPTEKKEPSALPESFGKHILADTRSAETFAKEEAKSGFKSWEDINPWAEGTEILPLGSIAARARKSPTINWMWNKLTTIDNELFITKEVAKYGSQFVPGSRGFEKHIKSDDGAMTILETLPKKSQDFIMGTFFEKFDGKAVPVDKATLLREGYSDREANGMLAARKALDDFAKKYAEDAKEFNVWAKENNRVQIPAMKPNYLPHTWRGDYRIFVKDSEGVNVKVFDAETIAEAKAIQEVLQAQHPQFTVEAPVLAKTASKYKSSSIQAYKEATEFLEKDSPERAILEKTVRDVVVYGGFRSTSLHRRGVEGFNTDIGIISDYLDRGYNFLANQQKKRAFFELTEKLKEQGMDLAKDQPNTFKYLTDVLDQSVGGLSDSLKLISQIGEAVSIGMGQGPKGIEKIVRTLNGVASSFLLSTPTFLSVQPLQVAFNAPKAFQLRKGPVDVTKAYGDSYSGSVSPTPEQIKALNWATRNGVIQTRIANVIEMNTGNPKNWVDKKTSWWMNKVIGKADIELARIPSFLFYDSLLKKEIPNNEARWHQAGILANEMMVNYTPTNSPLFFGRLGPIVGPMAKPFTQFPLSYFGQLLTYMGEAKSKRAIAPLATFLAVQALYGGVNGFLWVNDVNAVITKINEITGSTISTLEELLAKSDISNLVMYGGVSALTGVNISGTVSAPSVLNPPSMPGVQMGVKGAYNLFNLANKGIRGELLEADKMRAAQALLPRAATGAIEDYFTKPGKGTPNPYNDNMEPDLGPRKPGALGGLVQPDNWMQLSDKAARYMGSRSPQESREMSRVKGAKKAQKRYEEKANQYKNIIVDRVVKGQDFSDALIKFLDYHGDPSTLGDHVVNSILRRNQTFRQRFLGKVKGIQGARKAMLLQDFKLLIKKAPEEEQQQLLQEIENGT